MERETGYQDEECMTDFCRQCGEVVAVRSDDQQPCGAFVCDDCVRRTVNRAARPRRFSDYIFETAVEMARVRR